MRYLFIALLLFVAQLQAENIVKVPAPGTLSTLLTQTQKDTCTQLTVQGKLNSADIRVLRQMAGYKEDGCSIGVLRTLNLADAEFVTDKEPYMVLDAKEAMLAVIAVPATSTPSTFSMGEPLQNKHVIHQERYKNEYWNDYSSYRWNGNLLVNRTELVPTTSHSAPYYHASYYLGRSIDNPFHVIEDQFFFSDNFNDDTWKLFKRMGITKFKAHWIEKEGDKYIYYASSRKDYLPSDMFYGCTQLKKVILPSGIRVDDYIIEDQTSHVKYYLPNDELTIRYYGKNFRRWTLFPPYMLDGTLIKEKKLKRSSC